MMNQIYDPVSEDIWITAVQVATVWTSPASARDIDVAGTCNPTNIDHWIESLTYETNLALCEENRIQSQLLYGEPVVVTETKEDWAHIVIPSQPSKKNQLGYPGWVPLKQLKQVNKYAWKTPQTAIISDNKAWLENEVGDQIIKLSYLTYLPVAGITANRVKVKTPHGNSYLPKDAVHIFSAGKGIEPQGDGKAIVQAGEPFVGLAYFWGGMSAFGYDCSGLVYAAHKANGYQIGRDASDQLAAGKVIPEEQLQPGDLLFFAYGEGKGKLHHVGIYYGNGKMLHAPQTGKGIEITPLIGTIYEKELCAARRYWHETEVKA